MYHLCRRRCRRTAAAPRGGAAPARWRAHCRHTGRRRRRASSAPGARPPTRCHWPCGVRITWKTGLQGSLAIPLSGRRAKAGAGAGAGARAGGRQGEARAQPPRERVRPSRFELSAQRRAHARMVHRAATYVAQAGTRAAVLFWFHRARGRAHTNLDRELTCTSCRCRPCGAGSPPLRGARGAIRRTHTRKAGWAIVKGLQGKLGDCFQSCGRDTRGAGRSLVRDKGSTHNTGWPASQSGNRCWSSSCWHTPPDRSPPACRSAQPHTHTCVSWPRVRS